MLQPLILCDRKKRKKKKKQWMRKKKLYCIVGRGCGLTRNRMML